MTHGQVAKSVRLAKEKHPELYCSGKHCLYRTGGGDCPKHFREQLKAGIARRSAHEVGRCESCGDYTNDAEPKCNGAYCAKDGEL
jgi:hypothetical protein